VAFVRVIIYIKYNDKNQVVKFIHQIIQIKDKNLKGTKKKCKVITKKCKILLRIQIATNDAYRQIVQLLSPQQ